MIQNLGKGIRNSCLFSFSLSLFPRSNFTRNTENFLPLLFVLFALSKKPENPLDNGVPQPQLWQGLPHRARLAVVHIDRVAAVATLPRLQLVRLYADLVAADVTRGC